MKSLVITLAIILTTGNIFSQSTVDETIISDFKIIYDVSNDQAELVWLTLSERLNEGFVIESRGDSEEFEFEAYIDGKGSTDMVNEYRYLVEGYDSKHEFRIKQLGYNGNIEYFYPQEFLSGR